MNRRNFLTTTLKGLGLFTILPAATTYSRIWKAISAIPECYSYCLDIPYVPQIPEGLYWSKIVSVTSNLSPDEISLETFLKFRNNLKQEVRKGNSISSSYVFKDGLFTPAKAA